MKTGIYPIFIAGLFTLSACSKSSSGGNTPTPTPASFSFNSLLVNGAYKGFSYSGVSNKPVIRITFTAPIDHSSAASNISFTGKSGSTVAFTPGFDNHDSTVVITPAGTL
ncbi:MAG: hypothetical protein JST39_06570, partial [Bacteroidetes bacterium]|nr:hypothetical protein [Bacteroidota bacterium]